MKYLFVDTETTGLCDNPKASFKIIDAWPRLVSIAWIVCDDDKKVHSIEKFIAKTNGWTIPAEATAVHGITNEQANTEGIDIADILKEFIIAMSNCDYVIGHNIRFDRRVIAAELHRCFPTKMYDEIFYGMRYRDTMHVSREFCAIPYAAKPGKPASKGWKFPTLSEMHEKLYNGEVYENAHNASADIRATIKCYWRLDALGLVDRFYSTHKDTSDKE
jgi:DNA polymerase III epsilon subunit-like protein